MIGRSGERGSGISVIVALHDNDDDGESLFQTIQSGISTQFKSQDRPISNNSLLRKYTVL